MKPISENEMFQALEELRPEARPAFAAELDARVAAGFPRESHPRVLDRLKNLKPGKILLPAGATAFAAVLAVVVVIGTGGSESSDTQTISRLSMDSPITDSDGKASAGAIGTLKQSAVPMAAEQNFDGSGDYIRGAANLTNMKDRAIERSAQITLGTEPENVGRASSEVFAVVHRYRGVVLSSQTSDGSAAHAEAEFELLIPSGKLGDAMAGFSRIAAVRSRHEATNDITAPTVSTAAQLEDSRARIDSLLGQLADADSEGERETVERELRGERNRAAGLQASLENLERRASLSRVSLRIVGGEGAASADEGGAWGVGDALDDAGQVLGVAAAVTLLAFAVLAPVALVALLIWLARRTYLRRARQTALG